MTYDFYGTNKIYLSRSVCTTKPIIVTKKDKVGKIESHSAYHMEIYYFLGFGGMIF